MNTALIKISYLPLGATTMRLTKVIAIPHDGPQVLDFLATYEWPEAMTEVRYEKTIAVLRGNQLQFVEV